uniref:Aminotransferase-like plant mobile domain-containing protein n=2 Tax=Glycine max TaxID=3847 RepID=A0A0R0EYM1_SOYBN
MDESLLSMKEVREDFMVSPIGDSEPVLRSAYFLKPLAKSLDGPVSEVLSSSMTMPLPPVFEPKDWPLVIHFNWRCHTKKKCVEWVDSLQLRYESMWKKIGIFEAVMSTKCSIVKDHNLCFRVAEKASPLQSQEMREVKNKLILAREQPWRRTKAKASLSAWMDVLINSGSEVEHEAFLATWLSMIGFSSIGLVSTLVFPIAVHLGRGNPIALGPAVLASLYKDLTLLKNTVVGMTEQLVLGYKLELEVTLQSPFYLVQIWVWERFKNLQPQPRLNNHEDPMMFRCHKVKALKIDNVRLALDSAMKKYAGKFKVFYSENENLVLLNTDLDKEPTGLLVSFVTC